MPGLDVTPKPASGRQVIGGYGGGGFKISGQRHSGSVIVFPSRTLAWPVTTVEEITWELLAPLLDPVRAAEETVQILVLGIGARFRLPPGPLGARLADAGIALEWMDTGAACRTFNVLVLENRDVAAALLAID